MAERTYRTTISTPKGVDPQIQIAREELAQVDGKTFVRYAGTKQVKFSQVQNLSCTLASGKTLTVAEVAEAMSLLNDAICAT